MGAPYFLHCMVCFWTAVGFSSTFDPNCQELGHIESQGKFLLTIRGHRLRSRIYIYIICLRQQSGGEELVVCEVLQMVRNYTARWRTQN